MFKKLPVPPDDAHGFWYENLSFFSTGRGTFLFYSFHTRFSVNRAICYVNDFGFNFSVITSAIAYHAVIKERLCENQGKLDYWFDAHTFQEYFYRVNRWAP